MYVLSVFCVVCRLLNNSFELYTSLVWALHRLGDGWLKNSTLSLKDNLYVVIHVFCVYFLCIFSCIHQVSTCILRLFLRTWSCVENLTMSTLSYYTVHLVWSCMLRNNSCLKCLCYIISNLYSRSHTLIVYYLNINNFVVCTMCMQFFLSRRRCWKNFTCTDNTTPLRPHFSLKAIYRYWF